MECDEVKELLSEYMDDTLDSKTKVLVHEHVLACRGCKEVLALLRSLVGKLGSLEPLKAPDDFLDRLHERIEKRWTFTEFMRKLFVPMQIKIPMQFAALTAVALLVFAVGRIQQPHKRVDTTVKDSAPVELAKTIPSEVAGSTPKATVSTEPYSKEELGTIAERQVKLAKKEPMIAVKGKVEYEPDRLRPDSEAAVHYGPVGKAIDLAFEIEKGEIRALTVPGPSMKLALVDTPKPSTEGYASYIGKSAEKAPSLVQQYVNGRGSELERECLVMGVKDKLLAAGAKVISVDYKKFMKRPPSITAEVSARYYQSLIEEFRETDALKGSPPSIPDKDEKRLRVRFWFVSSK